jgi:hypothetical protein
VLGRRPFHRGEIETALFAVALLISMSALAWFGVDPTPGRARAAVSTVDAWHGLTILSWFMAITAALAIAAPPLHFSQRAHGARTDLSLPVAGLSSLIFVWLVIRVLIVLPDPRRIVDQKLGGLIGAGCALGLTLGAWRTVAAVRAAGVHPPVEPEHRRPHAATPPAA